MKLKFILLNCLVFASVANSFCISKEKIVHNAKGAGFAVLSVTTCFLGALVSSVPYILVEKGDVDLKNLKDFSRGIISPILVSSLMFYGSYRAGKKAYNYFKNQPKETQDTQVSKS